MYFCYVFESLKYQLIAYGKDKSSGKKDYHHKNML